MTAQTTLDAPSPPTVSSRAQRFYSSARMPELDGIRGVAIGMVVFYHYIALNVIPRRGSSLWYMLLPAHLGWAGVDLFFVLSGFLIGGILLEARGSPNYFQVFYTRRFFRIVPIYSVFLLCFFLLAHVSASSGAKLHSMTAGAFPWYSYAFFLQNFWMAFGNVGGPFATNITWSLAVEEQFYLTLPCLVRFLGRKRLVQLLMESLALALVLRVGLYCLWPRLMYSWFVLMPCRCDALAFGVLGAIVLRDPHWKNWLKSRRTGMLMLMVLLAAVIPILTRMEYSPYGFGTASLGLTCIAGFSLVLLLYALIFPDSRLSSCLRWTWLRKLGTLAYGIYLFHQLIFLVAYNVVQSHSAIVTTCSKLLLALLAFGLTLLVCYFSWFFFEKPLVAMGHRTNYEFEDDCLDGPLPPGPGPSSTSRLSALL
jgi:peptidoglycan/LPS O-acetylase OafA/YrhL